MFSRGTEAGVLNGGGEDFTTHGVRKKGRSLSQSSFLITNNFIHIPQSFEIVDRKKTLAFASRKKWNREENLNKKRDNEFLGGTSLKYDSSQNNTFSSSTGQSNKSNQSLFFLNESELQPSKFLGHETDESRTNLSVYKYNPIFPENHLFVNGTDDKISSLTSYTSVKHQILENIPFNILSNLNFFLKNGEKYESLVSSKSGFCPATSTSVAFKSNDPNLATSENSINFRNEQMSHVKLKSMNYDLKNRDRVCQKSCIFNSGLSLGESNGVENKLNSPLIVLKPASDSVSVSGSSESMITYGQMGNVVREAISSETFLESESALIGQEENDMHVHYINDSGSDESEYSLLISKGYTFANKLSSKKELERLNHLAETGENSSVLSDEESNGTTETELQIVDFSEHDLNNGLNHTGGINESEVNFNLQESSMNPLRMKAVNLEKETFRSCHSNSETKSSIPSSHQPLNAPGFDEKKIEKFSEENPVLNSSVEARNEMEKVQPKKEKLKLKLKNDKVLTRIGQYKTKCNDENNFMKMEKAFVKNGSSRPFSRGAIIQQNRSIRNTVKKISRRFMSNMYENAFSTDRESTTYSEMSYDSNAVEDECGDTSSGRSFSDQSDTTSIYSDGHFKYFHEPSDYSDTDYYRESEIVQKSKKPKFYRKEKVKPESYQDFSSGQSFVPRFRPKTLKKFLRNEMKISRIELVPRKFRKRFNYLASSTSNAPIGVRPGYSMYTITSVSTNSVDVAETNCSSRKGSSKNFPHSESKKETNEKLAQMAKQPKAYDKDEFKSSEKEELPQLNERKNYRQNLNEMQESNDMDAENQLTYSSNEQKEFCSAAADGKAEILKPKRGTEGLSLDNEMECHIINDKRGVSHVKDEMLNFCDKKDLDKSKESKILQFNHLEHDLLASTNKKEPFSSTDNAGVLTTGEKESHHAVGKRDMSTSTEQIDLLYSGGKEIYFDGKKDMYYTSDRRESYTSNDRKEIVRSSKLLGLVETKSNAINCCYGPQDSALKYTAQRSFIGDPTSEYISWAKNCIFSRVNKPGCVSAFSTNRNDLIDQDHFLKSETRDEYGRDKSVHFTIQKNLSVLGDRRIEITSISVSKLSSPSPVESMSSPESALSVIVEEKDASNEKLRSPCLSKKSSSVHASTEESSAHSIRLVQSLSASSSKYNSHSLDSLSSGKEAQTPVRSSKSRSNKSKILSIVSSESEEEYVKFKDEMKNYRKHVETQFTPRIIPSWSTFSPDKSCTQISSSDTMS